MPSNALRHVVIVQDHGYINGGAAKVAIDSALLLRQRGIDVSFVAGAGPMDRRLSEAGVKCVTIADHDVHENPNRRQAALNGLWNREAARILAGHLRDCDPRSSVVHLHAWSKALSPSIGPVVTGSQIPHVCTLHEYFLACPNGAFFNYTSGKICNLHAMGPGCLLTQCDARHGAHKAWRVGRQAVLRSAGRMPRSLRELIYLSPKQRSVMERYFPKEAHWHYLPNPTGEAPATRVLAESSDFFLFVGRLSPEKGAVVAAEAARRAGVRIVFAGDGSERDAVLRANPDAEILGWISPGEVDRWMRQARCLIFPSLWYETYGLVVADALRLGIPVLISENTVTTSLIANGGNGLHVPAGDIEAWAVAMSRLTDNDTVGRFSEAAFQAGAGLLSYDQYTDQLLKIYERVGARRHDQDPGLATCASPKQVDHTSSPISKTRDGNDHKPDLVA